MKVVALEDTSGSGEALMTDARGGGVVVTVVVENETASWCDGSGYQGCLFGGFVSNVWGRGKNE